MDYELALNNTDICWHRPTLKGQGKKKGLSQKPTYIAMQNLIYRIYAYKIGITLLYPTHIA